MNLGRTQIYLIVLLTTVLGLAVGGVVGYRLSAQRAEILDRQRLDLARALRANDLQNRLSTLRLLRERNVPRDDVSALETSALVLLDAISFENLTEDSSSRVVLARVAETMTGYRKDFPDSTFDPAKYPRVANLLSIKSNLRR